MFISLGAQMVNDNVALCRKSAAEAITLMLSKLSKNILSTLYNISLTWLEAPKVIHLLLNKYKTNFNLNTFIFPR